MTTYYVAPVGYPGASTSNDGTSSAAPKAFTYGTTDYTTWLNGLTNGDYVRQYPGDYHGTGYTQQVLTKQLVIDTMSYGADDLSEDWYGDGLPVASRFTRNVEWHGFFRADANLTTNGIHNRPMVWPGDWRTTSETWDSHSAPSSFCQVKTGVKWTRIKCEASLGYGPDGFVAFDTTRMYDEYKSPADWYNQGDGTIGTTPNGTKFKGHDNLSPNTTNYNAIAAAPRAFDFSSAGSTGGGLDCTDEYIHDVNYGAVCPSLVSGSTFEMTRVWIERYYNDAFQTSCGDVVWDLMHLHGCVIKECFGDPYDAGNPHSDVNQNYTTSATLSRIANLKLTNCLAFDPKGARSSPQFAWHQGPAGGTGRAVSVNGSLVSRCLVVGPQKLQAMWSSNSALLDKSIGVVPDDMDGSPPYSAPAGVSGSYFTGQTGDSGVIGSSFTQIVVGTAGQVRGSSSLVRDTICESINFTGKLIRENVTLVGHGGSSIALTDVFVDATTDRDTPAQVFAGFKPKGAYTSKGPGYATVRDMLEAPRSLAGQGVFVGLGDSTLCEFSQAIESLAFFVHGGDEGDLLPITVPAGVQWQVLDKDESTVLSAYSSSAGNAQAGKYLRLKRTSAAGASTKQSATISVGGTDYTWNVTTKSLNDLPGFSKPATAYMTTAATKFQRNGANYSSDTKEGIMWIDFMIPSTHGLATNTYNFITGLSGRTFKCGLGITASVFSIKLAFQTALAVEVANAQWLNLSYDKRYRIGISVDTSQADLAGNTHGNRVWAAGYNVTDNSVITPTTISSTKDALIGVTASHTANSIRVGDLVPMTRYGFYCEFERSFQQLGITAKDGWNYTADDIGPAGEGFMANPLHHWTGPHDNAATYQTNDGVTYSGKSYVSLVDENVGNLPSGAETDTAFWKHVRRRGAIWMPGRASDPSNLGPGNTFAIGGTGSFTDVNGQAYPPLLSLLSDRLTPDPISVGGAISFLVSPTGFPADVTITPSSDKAGSWSSATTLLPLGSTGSVLTFTPSEAGDHTISFANDASYTAPDSLVVSALEASSPRRATGLSLGLRLGL